MVNKRIDHFPIFPLLVSFLVNLTKKLKPRCRKILYRITSQLCKKNLFVYSNEMSELRRWLGTTWMCSSQKGAYVFRESSENTGDRNTVRT